MSSSYVPVSEWCIAMMCGMGWSRRDYTSRTMRPQKSRVSFDSDGMNCRWRTLRLQKALPRFAVLFVALSAFSVTSGFAQSPIRVQFIEGTKLDRIASIANHTVWAVGEGQVFVYDSESETWENVGTVSAKSSSAVVVGEARVLGGNLGNVGVVCFDTEGGLCSILIHDRNNRTYRVVRLSRNNFRNHGSVFSVITPLEVHGADSGVLFAVNQKGSSANESPLSLLKLTEDNLKVEEMTNTAEGFSPFKRTGDYSMMFATDEKFQIKYLYAFYYNGFGFVVTVQPMVKDRKFPASDVLETRVARFCLNDSSLKSYTEMPISCQSSTTRFDVAVHARHFVRGVRHTLLVAMSQGHEDGLQSNTTKASALCSFDVDYMIKMFDEAITSCNGETEVNLVRQSSFYQKTDVRGPLPCQRANDEDHCSPRDNAFIISMSTIEGVVRFSSQKKRPPDVTYVYNKTRQNGVEVGVLTTFELEKPMDSTPGEPIFVWVADHRGYIHRVLINEEFNIQLVTVESSIFTSIAGHPYPIDTADRNRLGDITGPIIDSTQSPNRIHFLMRDRIIEIDTSDTCAFYKSCGDCLNPRRATNSTVNCKWDNHRCVPGTGTDSCVPEIDLPSSGPFQGPSDGGGVLTLHGHDFGDSPALTSYIASIKIGKGRCKIVAWNMTVIQCNVPSQNDAASGDKAPILLSVNDLIIDERYQTYQISSNGYQNVATYTYFPVKFHGVFPSFGPDKGGTTLSLTGENIGYRDKRVHYKLIGTTDDTRIQICDKFVVINRTHLTCNTNGFESSGHEQSLSLELEIGSARYRADGTDNTAELFQYAKTPSKIEMDKSAKLNYFFGGGRGYEIVFKGDNLNASVQPHIEVGTHGQFVREKCRAPNKTMMTCKAPSLIGTGVRLSNRPIYATIELHFDGYIHKMLHEQLTYYPNATIDEKNIPQAIAGPTGETRVTIHGTNLAPLTEDDFEISIAERPCKVNTISDLTIVCTADIEPGEYPVEVKFTNGALAIAGIFQGELNVIGQAAGMDWTIIVAIVCVVLILATAGILVTFYYFRMRMKVERSEPVVTFTPENDGYLNPDNERLLATIPPDPEIIQQLSDWGLLMDFSCIQVGALIGKGQFGCVYRGVLKRDKLSDEEAVAVKTLQQRGYTTNDANVFLKEALRMKDFNHPNVLCLIGVSFDNNNSTDPMIIVPYMANGDLLMYIRNQDNTPTVKDLITFGANIAQGMSYLTSQKFIHRDLAARNCMVGEDMIVRVADFGLSRDVYETSYYSSDNAKTKLPVKWMALESLIGGYYSHKSDVWSFGVVLWELMTRGCQPYPSVDNWEVHLWLKEGRRMLQPAYCPDALYKIMLQCWHEDPQERPTFSQLVKDVPNVIHTIEMSTRNSVPQYVNT